MSSLIDTLISIFSKHEHDSERQRLDMLDERKRRAFRFCEKTLLPKIPRMLMEAAEQGRNYIVILTHGNEDCPSEYYTDLHYDKESPLRRFTQENNLILGQYFLTRYVAGWTISFCNDRKPN